MADFPQLTEEDYQVFTRAMEDLMARSEAGSVLLIEKAGHLIHTCGNGDYDATAMAALASNTFNAVQFMAGMLAETNFNGMYQQGDKLSTVLLNVDEHLLLMIIFPAHLSVGAVRFYAAETIKTISAQLEAASSRIGNLKFDLTDLDIASTEALFRKKNS